MEKPEKPAAQKREQFNIRGLTPEYLTMLDELSVAYGDIAKSAVIRRLVRRAHRRLLRGSVDS